jgi:nucleoid DNA-binding protein
MAPAPADARIVNNGQQFNTLIDDVGHVKAVKKSDRIRIGGLGILQARKRAARKARSR